MIESTAVDSARLPSDSRSYVPLLGTDISAILRAQSASVKHVCIEQTAKQNTLSRETAILQNLLSAVRPGGLTAVLFGALHCGDFDGWL